MGPVRMRRRPRFGLRCLFTCWLVAIVRKRLRLAASLLSRLQFLSVTLSRKRPFHALFRPPEADAEFAENVNQLTLFDI